MNRLKICQDVNNLGGLQGQIDDTVSPVGYQHALIKMVDKAYSDIQTYRKYWHFMRRKELFSVDEVVDFYANDDIALVDRVVYNKRPLYFVNYDDFLLKTYKPSKPTFYTVDPATAEIFINPLDTTYILGIQYFKNLDVMTANSDVPILPSRYHDLITYKALMDLGSSYLGNYDLASTYSLKYSMLLGSMMRTQLPSKKLRARPFVI